MDATSSHAWTKGSARICLNGGDSTRRCLFQTYWTSKMSVNGINSSHFANAAGSTPERTSRTPIFLAFYHKEGLLQSHTSPSTVRMLSPKARSPHDMGSDCDRDNDLRINV
jgi:hypothetical protein